LKARVFLEAKAINAAVFDYQIFYSTFLHFVSFYSREAAIFKISHIYELLSVVCVDEKVALNGALRALAYYLLLILILRLTGIAPDGNV